MRHHMRMKPFIDQYDMVTLNKAMDQEVNSMIKDMSMDLHPDWFYESAMHGMAFEDALKHFNADQNSQGQGQDDGQDDGQDQDQDQDDQNDGQGKSQPGSAPCDVEPYQPESGSNPSSDMQEESDAMKRAFIAAAVEAEMIAGSLPASMKRMLAELQKPKVDWSVLLSQFVTEKFPDDYSWSRPRQQFGCLLPTLDGEQAGELVFAIDTSGSVTDDELKEFASEAISAITTVSPSKTHLLWFDKQVYPQTFDSVPELKDFNY